MRASAVELPGGRDLHWPTVAELDTIADAHIAANRDQYSPGALALLEHDPATRRRLLGLLPCWYCGTVRAHTSGPFARYTLREHVTPTSRGGTDQPSNLVDACRQCNNIKSSRTLDEWRAEHVETWARGRAWRATLAADDPILPYLTPLPDPAAAVFYGESPEGAWMSQPSPDPVIVRAWRYTLTELDAIADDWVADIRARRGGGAAAG